MQEVPFEIKPAAGFYGTDKKEHPAVPTFKQSMALQSLEGKRRDDIEAEERKNDKQRQKRKQEKNLPEHVEAISRMNDAEQVANGYIMCSFLCCCIYCFDGVVSWLVWCCRCYVGVPHLSAPALLVAVLFLSSAAVSVFFAGVCIFFAAAVAGCS